MYKYRPNVNHLDATACHVNRRSSVDCAPIQPPEDTSECWTEVQRAEQRCGREHGYGEWKKVSLDSFYARVQVFVRGQFIATDSVSCERHSSDTSRGSQSIVNFLIPVVQ